MLAWGVRRGGGKRAGEEEKQQKPLSPDLSGSIIIGSQGLSSSLMNERLPGTLPAHFKFSTSRAPCSVVLSGELLASLRRALKRPPRSPHGREHLRQTRTTRSGRRANGQRLRRRMRDRCTNRPSLLFSWSELVLVKKEGTIS